MMDSNPDETILHGICDECINGAFLAKLTSHLL